MEALPLYLDGLTFRTDLEMAEELFEIATGNAYCESVECGAEWAIVASIAAEMLKRARS